MLASNNGHLEICALLLEKGADKNIQNKVSMSVMYICVYMVWCMVHGVCLYVVVTAVYGVNGCGELRPDMGDFFNILDKVGIMLSLKRGS